MRLAFNPYLLGYPIGPTPIFNWLLYGYGVPALAFVVATKQFGSRKDDLLVHVLEAGSALFTTLLLTFELRHALYGRIDAPLTDLGKGVMQWHGEFAGALRNDSGSGFMDGASVVCPGATNVSARP